MKLQHESIARELELHPRCFTPEAVVPNQGERDERGTSQADLEHVRQDADFIFICARFEFIKYSVFGHVAIRFVVMLHLGFVSLEMPRPRSMTIVFSDGARGRSQSSI